MRNSIPTWVALRKIGKSKIVGMTIFIPFFGYMILFNDQFVHLFSLSKELFLDDYSSNTSVALDFAKEGKNRLFYFYFGFTFLGIASLIYKLSCPSLINDYGSDRDFIKEELPLITIKRGEEIIQYLSEKKASSSQEIENIKWKLKNSNEINNNIDLMSIYWGYENTTKISARMASALLYLFGFSILMIPAIAMFIDVSTVFFN
ncbi:hypothetical protein SAMN05660964_01198 [Thiothrix caldifontis]|uniref:Uncharacterized protein n=1 Tax=Thiothrix caldifontis TaxID=525918 RepID=A0A1H3ZJ61_9GAMM|nr:hypothetical protein [Thiothrix caldifontis]SEA23809.1 hypothetical protein SAMN05660964_01198 [Thiothrix caldifontis]